MDAYAFHAAGVRGEGKRAGARFIEHCIRASVAVSMDFSEACGHLCGGQGDSASILRAVEDWQPRDIREDGSGDFIPDLFRDWGVQWTFDPDQLLIWPVCPLVARAMSLGQLTHDVSIIWRRDRGSVAPSVPHILARALSEFCKQGLRCAYPAPPRSDFQADLGPVLREQRGCIRRVRFRTALASLRGSQHLKAQDTLEEATNDLVEFDNLLRYGSEINPARATLPDRQEPFPTRWTLCRARMRLDIASMLARRGVYVREGPFFRFVSFDASPQRPGVEVFASLERTLRQEVVALAFADGHWPEQGQHDRCHPVEIRRLPLATLGQGRASLSDKVQAHCHQCWLEYGQSMEALRAANADVRGVLSDMGVELGIGDYADILDDMYPQGTAVEPHNGRLGHLYPFALVVPGPQHIIDNVVKTCLGTIPWWSQWQAASKALCQWLSAQNHREVLQRRLREKRTLIEATRGADSFQRLHDSLKNTCDRFANWRWKTISNVTAGLIRMEAAVRTAIDDLRNISALGTRDPDVIKRVVEAIRSQTFWDRVHALSATVRPLADLTSWLRGCPCHEQHRLRGIAVVPPCPWAGCRAFEFADKLRAVEADLRRSRDVARPVGISSSEWVPLHSAILSTFQLKFQWAFEAPYTVWSIRDEATARTFLEAYEEARSAGMDIHRVTHFLAGPDAWTLRHDLDILASVGVHTDRLWAELQAYRMCPLDETAIEAVHRDVSRESKRVGVAVIPLRAATLRLKQSLKAFKNGSGQYQEDVKNAYSTVSAITRTGRTRPGAHLKRVGRCSFRRAVNFAYRCDEAKHVHWGIFEERMKLFDALPRKAANGARLRLLKQHLATLLIDGAVFSVPLATSGALQEVADIEDIERAADILDRSAQGESLIFQVLDVQVGHKKIMARSTQARALRRMRWPVRIQRLSVWRGGPAYPAQAYDLCMEVDAENVDILDLAPWPVYRLALRRWSVAECDVSGCMRVCDSECLASRPFPSDISSASALACVEQLLKLGWTLGAPPDMHKAESPRHFSANDPVRQKLYLECLLRLDELLPRHPDGIPSDGNQATYQDILKGKPIGSRTGDDGATAPLVALEDGDVGPADDVAQDAAPDSESDNEIEPPSRPILRCPPSKRLRTSSKPVIGEENSVADLFMRLKGDGAVVTRDQIDVGGGAASSSAADIAHGDTERREDTEQGGIAEEGIEQGDTERREVAKEDIERGDIAGHLPDAALVQRSVERPLPIFLEGRRVIGDSNRGTDVRTQFYDRIKLTCDVHRGCSKRRNTGIAQCAHYGKFEPYAYMGVWMRAKNRFATKSEHLSFAPTDIEVAAYMDEKGWPRGVS